LPITTAGIYTIDVTSLEGIGDYIPVAFVNADVELELVNGTSNNSAAPAQDLAPSSISLEGTADRLAVFGEKADGTDDDFYRVDLTAGQVAFVMATPDRGGNLDLSLLDSNGTTELARGIATFDNVGEVIQAFRATSTGTYYVKVSGTAKADPDLGLGFYNLIVTRGSAFDLEPNTLGAQEISLTGQVLGSVGLQRSSGEDEAWGIIRVAVLDAGNAGPVVAQLNDDTFYNFAAAAVTAAQIDTPAELANYDVVVIGDPASRTALESIATTLKTWVEGTGGAVVGTGGLIQAAGTVQGPSISDIDAIIPINTAVSPSSLANPSVTIINNSYPVTQGLTTPFSLSASLEYSTSGGAQGDVLATADGQPAVAISGNNAQGRSVWVGPKYFDAASTSLRSGDGDRLLEQVVAWAGRSGIDQADQYSVSVNAGDVLTITTSTPGDGANQPSNTLNPKIELYNPSGVLVASNSDDPAGDGHNARIVNFDTTGQGTGLYRVRVLSEGSTSDPNSSNAYTLRITGATGAVGGPGTLQAVAFNPGPGATVTSVPTTYQIQFSGPLLLTTLQASDLKIDGQPAANFTIVDGQTIRFDITGLVAAPRAYTATIAGGDLFDIRGNSNAPISRTFTYAVPDTTGPTVTDIRVHDSSGVERPLTPTTIVAPGSATMTITFSEDLAQTGLGAEDVLLTRTDDPSSLYVPTAFSYNPLIRQLMADFQGLRGGEQYRLTLVSGSAAFRDLAGNPLNGAPGFPLPSGQGHPAGDDFAVEFWSAAPRFCRSRPSIRRGR
jgi:hypothetical protein